MDDQRYGTSLFQQTILKIEELKRLVSKCPQYCTNHDGIIKWVPLMVTTSFSTKSWRSFVALTEYINPKILRIFNTEETSCKVFFTNCLQQFYVVKTPVADAVIDAMTQLVRY
ncbi:MAG: hypothetical protein WBE68_15085 [Candidatus Nitrosopolaris sp.]